MSTNISVSRAMTVQVDPEKAHRSRLGIAYAIAGVLTLIQIVYGSNYYILSQANRALSPKHAWLKPSGVIGLHLGMVAFALFLIVYVYPLRKIWPWLGRQGNPRHWLDFHVLMGLLRRSSSHFTLPSSFPGLQE